MSRGWSVKCPYCRKRYWQDWEEVDGCPYCPGYPGDDNGTLEEDGEDENE
jgi:ssDNA-binding Zn-finger/Zn-ribbon topoisomerase 1